MMHDASMDGPGWTMGWTMGSMGLVWLLVVVVLALSAVALVRYVRR